MSTLANNVPQVVYYQKQVGYFGPFCAPTPLLAPAGTIIGVCANE